QVVGDLVRYESRSQPRAIKAPVHEPHGYQVPLVVLTNCGDKLLYPLPSNVGPRPLLLIQRDDLDEVLAAERWAEPVTVLAFTAWHYWLVHQVVTEDGRPVSAS